MIDLGRVLNDGIYNIKLTGGNMVQDVAPDVGSFGGFASVRFTDYIIQASGEGIDHTGTKTFQNVQAKCAADGATWTVQCPALGITVGASDAHLVVIEVLDSDGEVAAWCEMVCDVAGGHTQTLRLPPVEPMEALQDQALRATAASLQVEIATTGPTPPRRRQGGRSQTKSSPSSITVSEDASGLEDGALPSASGLEGLIKIDDSQGTITTATVTTTTSAKWSNGGGHATEAEAEATTEASEDTPTTGPTPPRHRQGRRQSRPAATAARTTPPAAAAAPTVAQEEPPAAVAGLDDLMEIDDAQATPQRETTATYTTTTTTYTTHISSTESPTAAGRPPPRPSTPPAVAKPPAAGRDDIEATLMQLLLKQKQAEADSRLRLLAGCIREAERDEREAIERSYDDVFKNTLLAERTKRFSVMSTGVIVGEATSREAIDAERRAFYVLQTKRAVESRVHATEAERQRKTFVPNPDGTTLVGVDAMEGLPVSVCWTRLRFFVADEEAAPAAPGPSNGNRSGAISPSLISIELFATSRGSALQDFDSPCSDPVFRTADSISMHLGPGTTVVALVDCALKEEFGRAWFTLGHAVMQVSDWVTAPCGHFTSKVRLGDPRASAFHDEAARIREGLETQPDDEEAYVPGVILRWRKNSLHPSVTGATLEPADSPSEFEDRVLKLRNAYLASIVSPAVADNLPLASSPVKGDKAAAHADSDEGAAADDVDPKRRGAECEAVLFAPHLQRVDPGTDVLTFLTPHDAPLDIFLNVESLLGAPIVPKGLLKVSVEIVTALNLDCSWEEEKARRTGFTALHDFSAPIYLPSYMRDPLVFEMLSLDKKAFALIRVFSVPTLKHHEVNQVGWTVSRLFYKDCFLRQGRFVCPLFAGRVPALMLQQLRSSKLDFESVVLTSLQKGTVPLAEPRMLVRFSQGYIDRCGSILAHRGPFAQNAGVYIKPLAPDQVAQLEAPPPGGGAVTKPLSAMFGNAPDKTFKVQTQTNELLYDYIAVNVPRVMVKRRHSCGEASSVTPRTARHSSTSRDRLISFFNFEPEAKVDPVSAEKLQITEMRNGAATKLQQLARRLRAKTEVLRRQRRIADLLDKQEADELRQEAAEECQRKSKAKERQQSDYELELRKIREEEMLRSVFEEEQQRTMHQLQAIEGARRAREQQEQDLLAQEEREAREEAQRLLEQEPYRERVDNMYAKYNPERRSSVPELMKKFYGQEEDVIARMVEKYGPEPLTEQQEREEAQRQQDEEAQEAQRLLEQEPYRERVDNMYAKYNPERRSSVPELMKKFYGQEEDVITRMVEKYGPEPFTEQQAREEAQRQQEQEAAAQAALLQQHLADEERWRQAQLEEQERMHQQLLQEAAAQQQRQLELETFSPSSIATEPSPVDESCVAASPNAARKLSVVGDDEEKQKEPEQLSAYTADAGYFLHVQGLSGVDPACHYRVVVAPPAPGLPYLAGPSLPVSDAGCPRFKETPVVVTGTAASDLSNAIFYLLAYFPGTGDVRSIAWTVARLFTSGCSRKGRFHVPWFDGPAPPPALVAQATTDPLRVVIKAWLVDRRRSSLTQGALAKAMALNQFAALGKMQANARKAFFSTEEAAADETRPAPDAPKKDGSRQPADEGSPKKTLDYMKPRCVLTIGQGSPGDMSELCFADGLPPASVVLVIPKRHAEFPLGPADGRAGVPVEDVSGQDAAGPAFDAYFQREWLSRVVGYRVETVTRTVSADEESGMAS